MSQKQAGSYLERVILGEDRGFASWVIRWLLLPLSVLYRLGLAVYLGIYSVDLRKRCKLNVPVISVGNLTFGGTGKTPAVQAICKILSESGKRVVVLSRGHGGSAKGPLIVSDGKSILCESSESGDEPMLLATSLPGIPVVVGKDRRLSGALACKEFSPDVIVLDDGLQYWQLYRDLNVVVLNAAKPFGSGFVMPMGDLREPISGLKRAGAVLLSNSRAVSVDTLNDIIKRVHAIAPQAECFSCAHVPLSIQDAATGEKLDLDWIRHRKVVAFCGIGRPASFIDMLKSLDADMRECVVFPDHHAYCPDNYTLIKKTADRHSVDAIITTAKDYARLQDKTVIPNLYILDIELEIEDSPSFASYIRKTINR